MTNEEALEIVKKELAFRESDYIEYLECGGVPVENEFKIHKATRIAIDALEKQIQKKPKEKHNLGDIDRYVYGFCASCGEPINYEFRYCPMCGQKADWSNEE